MSSRTAVGIDLGTGFSAYCVVRNGRLTQGSFPNDGAQLPSVVHVSGEEWTFGQRAFNKAIKEPDQLYAHFKRLVPVAPIEKIGGVGPTPKELMTELLRYILKTIRSTVPNIGDAPDQVTYAITHPSGYRQVDQKVLLEAAIDAGIPEEQIVLYSEPVAGSFWLREKADIKEGELTLVVDSGAGTTDITLLEEVSGRSDERVAGKGDGALGGVDWTGELFRHFTGKQKLPHLSDCFDSSRGLAVSGTDLDDNDRRCMMQFWKACEDAKRELSDADSAETFVQLPDGTHELAITRDEYQALCRSCTDGDLYGRFERAVKNCLDGVEPAISLSDVHHVVLIGGSAKTVGLRELVAGITERPVEKVYLSTDSETVVAAGAAYRAFASDGRSDPAQGLPGGATYRVRLGAGRSAGYVNRLLLKPGHIIPSVGAIVESPDNYVESRGGLTTISLSFGELEAGSSDECIQENGSSLPTVGDEHVVNLHRTVANVELPPGRHPVTVALRYSGRRLFYQVTFPTLQNIEPLSGSFLDDGDEEPDRDATYDVVFTVDTSASMADAEKLVRAKEAFRLVSKTLLERGHRVGVVAFQQDSARVLCSLTDDPKKLHDAIASLVAGGATPLDAGINEAQKSLSGIGAGNRSAMVLLTDGLPNSYELASVAATNAKERGTKILVLGVGDDAGLDLNEEFLRHQIASTPACYRYVSDADGIVDALTELTELFILEQEGGNE